MPHFARLLWIALLVLSSAVAHAERLRIVSDDWAPYVHLQAGQPAGVHQRLAAEVFRRLGIEVDWQFMPWRRCLAMVEQGQADGVLDVLHTPERERYLVYAPEPLSQVEFVLFQSRTRPHPVHHLEDLAGLLIGTSPDYDYGPAFNTSTLFRRETAQTHEANFGKLVRGRIDMLVTDRHVGHYLIQQMGIADSVEMLPLLIQRRPQYLALGIRPGAERLAQRFAEELQRLRQEPGFQAFELPEYTRALPDAIEQQDSGTP
ncbi:transporter substrate-binding domain-containing protein [Pseudomonas entomophila]|uniref:substrate-binding periplasmic protein n=1 Tax=Pseudomonas entomophila TaxID=312306 RepID=UPI0015E2F397|nr:transporter substrate-binding domain-containing protein [Pseudomonas entomophila]MBA1193998.1 transporter substrate-binding domain-containing protein [Pseudomonas entomophila]